MTPPGLSYGDGQFLFNIGIGIAPDGSVYFVDQGNHRIQRFDADGNYLGKWGAPGTGLGQFQTRFGIAIDAIGDVYVTDNGNNRVQKFSASGTYLSQWGSQGSGNCEFNNPFGIAVDEDGGIYVAERLNHRVQKFRPAAGQGGDGCGSVGGNTSAGSTVSINPVGTLPQRRYYCRFADLRQRDLRWQHNSSHKRHRPAAACRF